MDCPRHLRYVSDDTPGLTRKKRGRGFTYFDVEGIKISSATILERIKNLGIPPAWTKVWICPLANGHLQCTGNDVKNRKQYIYHVDWVTYRKNGKFGKLASFGELLPIIRETVDKDMRKRGWPREKVLALVVYLMDRYYFRVGQQRYARENNSYGIATLRRKHLREQTNSLTIKYVGKSGKLRRVDIDDRSIIRKIKQLSELPGYEIFKYHNGNNQLQSIDASDINEYLREITGAEITAKDFRTWGGTKLSLAYYDDVCDELRNHNTRKFETALIRKVAENLGNTVAVCREYYIHPKVLHFLVQHYNEGKRQLPIDENTEKDIVEQYLLELLTEPQI
ncbi:MAG: hypothetical protein WBB23_04575 [Desulforhopalus sp.]